MASEATPPEGGPHPVQPPPVGLLRRLVGRVQAARTSRVTVIKIDDPRRPARRYQFSLLTLYILGLLVLLLAAAITYRIADSEMRRAALRRQEQTTARLLAERQQLIEARAKQEERLVGLSLDVKRLQKEVDQVRSLKEAVERLLAEGPAAAAFAPPQGASGPPEPQGGAGGGDLSEAAIGASIKKEIGKATLAVRSLARDMKGLQGDVTAFNRRIEHTPSIWPVAGRVTSPFGNRVHPVTGNRDFHEGMDIAAERGTAVRATAAGKVVLAGRYGGYGLAVVIDHGNGLKTLYGHNSRLAVSVGQTVHKGELISYVGSTGLSTGPHVHYQVTREGKPIDPGDFLPSKN